jgi:dethiobiotin synthetase
MKKGLFISGTSTGVGKTVVSAIICRLLAESRVSTCYYKPVQTGSLLINGKETAPDCRFVKEIISDYKNCGEYCTYLYKKPASPHLASRLENSKIKIDKITEDYNKLAEKYDAIITEGAGGLYVPLNDDLDLVSHIPLTLNLNTVLIADAGLGTINHVSLSVKYAESIRNHVSAVILIYYGSKPTDIENENLCVLKRITKIDNIYLFPSVDGVDTESNKAGDFFNKIKHFPKCGVIKSWMNE